MAEFIVLPGGIYFPSIKTLAVSDLQLGFEEAMRKQGFALPISQLKLIKQLFDRMLGGLERKKMQVGKVVINGDLKHEFARLEKQEYFEITQLIQFLKDRKLEVKIVRGNHDNYLLSLTSRLGIDVPEFLIENEILFVHGDKIPGGELLGENKPLKTIVIGHEHPAIKLKDELGIGHKFKCALQGEWEFKGKAFRKKFQLIVLPAMSPLAAGTAINEGGKAALLSPILRQCNLDEFTPFVIEEDIVKEFPKIKHL